VEGEGVAALDALCRPRTNRGRRYARFSPLSPTDLALFRAAIAGEHAIQGFRTTDLPDVATAAQSRIAGSSTGNGTIGGTGVRAGSGVAAFDEAAVVIVVVMRRDPLRPATLDRGP
jgi:hypothetical protein